VPKYPKYKKCTLWFCPEKHYGRGLCANHYQNFLRGGGPLPAGAVDLITVLRKVDEFRVVLQNVIGTVSVMTRIRVSGQLVGLRCNSCNAEITVEDGVDAFPLEAHAVGCPIAAAQIILDETVSSPPDDYYSYPLSWQDPKSRGSAIIPAELYPTANGG
jgi:hypothetical protein